MYHFCYFLLANLVKYLVLACLWKSFSLVLATVFKNPRNRTGKNALHFMLEISFQHILLYYIIYSPRNPSWMPLDSLDNKFQLSSWLQSLPGLDGATESQFSSNTIAWFIHRISFSSYINALLSPGFRGETEKATRSSPMPLVADAVCVVIAAYGSKSLHSQTCFDEFRSLVGVLQLGHL